MIITDSKFIIVIQYGSGPKWIQCGFDNYQQAKRVRNNMQLVRMSQWCKHRRGAKPHVSIWRRSK